MSQDLTLTTATLRAPKAAAVAGILFSALLAIAFVLLRTSPTRWSRERGSGHVRAPSWSP